MTATAKTSARKPATSAKAETPAAPKLCACGCGEAVVRQTATFRMGHDARHASNLVKRYVAGELTRAAAIKAARQFSDKLGDKVANGCRVADERKAKKAAADKDRAAKAKARAAAKAQTAK